MVFQAVLRFSGVGNEEGHRSRKRGGRNPRPHGDLSSGAPLRGSPKLASPYPCGVGCRLRWHRRAQGGIRTRSRPVYSSRPSSEEPVLVGPCLFMRRYVVRRTCYQRLARPGL